MGYLDTDLYCVIYPITLGLVIYFFLGLDLWWFFNF
jgi:hypothetical protein